MSSQHLKRKYFTTATHYNAKENMSPNNQVEGDEKQKHAASRHINPSITTNDQENFSPEFIEYDEENIIINDISILTDKNDDFNENLANNESYGEDCKQIPNYEIAQCLKTISESLNTIKITQANMQKQIDGLHNAIEMHLKNNNSSNSSNVEKIIKETLVYSQQTYKGIRRLFGQNMSEIEERMASFLPLNLMSEMENLEAALETKENEDAMRSFLVIRKGNQPLNVVIRSCIEDTLLSEFNWDGRAGRKALNKYKFFSTIIRDVFQELDKKTFESQIRKSIDLSHNRNKQKLRHVQKTAEKTD